MEDFGKLTIAQLKARCKAAGVAGTGEKPDLVTRMKQVAQGESLKIDGPLLYCGVRTAAATASRVCYARALEL